MPTHQLKVSEQKYVTFSLQVCLITPALPVHSHLQIHRCLQLRPLSTKFGWSPQVFVLSILPTWPSSPSIHAAIPFPPHIPTSTAVFLPALMKTFVILSLRIQNITTKPTSSAPGFLHAILLSSTRNKKCVSILRLFYFRNGEDGRGSPQRFSFYFFLLTSFDSLPA